MSGGHRKELSRWAGLLAESSDPQSAAAGRAILSLCAANTAGTPIDLGAYERLAKNQEDG